MSSKAKLLLITITALLLGDLILFVFSFSEMMLLTETNVEKVEENVDTADVVVMAVVVIVLYVEEFEQLSDISGRAECVGIVH